LRRTSKTSNLHGAEKLGIAAWDGHGKFESAVVFRGGRAVLPADLAKAVSGAIIGVGVFNKEAVGSFAVVLPGLSSVEKSGTIVNWQGKEQQLEKAIAPVGQSKSLSEVFELWG
jgi:NADH dehydrogenase/NADH:ubiquinone oxidoreductase subunit G